MDKVKLVIWDLDETLWSGTLSEGPIHALPERISLIPRLAQSGVVSSVCSKNEFADARALLEELSIWKYFVFPSIEWGNKGTRVSQIIKATKLRPQNVVFVDDNANNLEEVAFYNQGITALLPEEFDLLVEKLLSECQPDDGLTRLAHYQVMEVQANERALFGSNEEFLYQSQIEVEFIACSESNIGRIHEMIHRNNQLNFTKNRISLEETRQLFLSECADCACISVRDKYGDHGIVGCYAFQGNVLAQFVFSCRILGMGIEQWVYAKLGYPAVSVVGPVAVSLVKDYSPDWIHEAQHTGASASKKKANRSASIAFYGSCPLRPIWAYIQPMVQNALFREIDPEPSVCNLASTLTSSPELIQTWLNSVSIFDAEGSFDFGLFSGLYDYIVVSLDSEMGFFKYSNGDDSFYAPNLSARQASPLLLKEYRKTKITYADIEESLRTISDEMPNGISLVIVLIPEVEFPLKGRDENYHDRLRLNEIAINLEKKRRNVVTVNLGRYAKSPADFYNEASSHYNRSIGFEIARDIVELIGSKVESGQMPTVSSAYEEMLPFDKGALICRTSIVNGRFHLNISHTIGMEVMVEIRCGHESFFGPTVWDGNDVSVRVEQPGYWHAVICVDDEVRETSSFDYSSRNYMLFADRRRYDFSEFLETSRQFALSNQKYEKNAERLIRQVIQLESAGVVLSEYFHERGIQEIAIYADDDLADVVIPFIACSSLTIRGLFLSGSMNAAHLNGGVDLLLASNLETDIPDSAENVLLACSGRKKADVTELFCSKGKKVHYIANVTASIMTRHFVCDRARESIPARLVALRAPKLHPFHSFPFKYILPQERSSYRKWGKCHQVHSRVIQAIEINNGEPSDSLASLKETTVIPGINHNKLLGYSHLADISSPNLNISRGIRMTIPRADGAGRRIYIYGTSYSYGFGLEDKTTIASYLQSMLQDEYQVINCATAVLDTDYGAVIRRMLNTTYQEGDIIVLLITCWQAESAEVRWHWFDWDSCTYPVIKLDAFPLFARQDREQYFAMDGAYTPAGAKAIAELIYSEIESSRP